MSTRTIRVRSWEFLERSVSTTKEAARENRAASTRWHIFECFYSKLKSVPLLFRGSLDFSLLGQSRLTFTSEEGEAQKDDSRHSAIAGTPTNHVAGPG